MLPSANLLRRSKYNAPFRAHHTGTILSWVEIFVRMFHFVVPVMAIHNLLAGDVRTLTFGIQGSITKAEILETRSASV